jgi:hemoglobin
MARRHHEFGSNLACVATPPTLYEWAGGSDALTRMINAFYDRVEQDELLSPFFPGGVHEDHRSHVATWWGEVFGGPPAYTEELGGYERMLSKHLDLKITESQRFRFTELMRLAADDAGMPDDPEFRSALVAYLEWGTRIALGNSQSGAAVMKHAPVPKWGWGEAPPYQP